MSSSDQTAAMTNNNNNNNAPAAAKKPAVAASTATTKNTTPQKRKGNTSSNNNNNNRRRRGGGGGNGGGGNGGSSSTMSNHPDTRPKGQQGQGQHQQVNDGTSNNNNNSNKNGGQGEHAAAAAAGAAKKKRNNRNRRNNNSNNNNKKGSSSSSSNQPVAVGGGGGNVSNQDEMMSEASMERNAAAGVASAASSTSAACPSDNNSATNTSKPHITGKRFADLQNKISAASRRALSEVFQYEFMTVVQEETLPVILDGNDCLAKAKTGTGKTLAFMIPAVEKILEQRNNNNKNNKSIAMDISCLIISPTRELTFQICAEAQKLVQFQQPNMRVVACVGGTNINADKKALEHSVQFLVATPGRLLDHLTNTETKNGVKLVHRLQALQVLILDEMDQLLDQGFRPDIQRILNMLAPSRATRQTLLFSATVPDSVAEIADLALKSPHKYVDTVGEDQEQTHLHVKQELYVTRPGVEQIRGIWQILLAEIAAANANKEPYKIIVFFTTARLTGFLAELFNSIPEEQRGFGPVLEIHSRKSQSVRQKASDKFRQATTAVLFSSDVSARGMDYPDVTFVLQVGLTNRAQYIHRLGRTARQGKDGKGGLLLAVEEERFMTQTELNDMPLIKLPVPVNGIDTNPSPLTQALKNVARDKELKESAEQAYRAWLGYYNGHLKKVGWDKKQLVVAANQWVKDLGIAQPKIQRKTIGKMGLKGVPGLLLE